MQSKTIGRILYATIALALAAVVFIIYLSISGTWSFGPATFPKMMAGTADRPYVYRILIPTISKWAAPLVPQWLIDLFSKAPESVRKTINALSEGVYTREAIVAVILMYGSLVGFIFAEKSLLKQLNYPKDETRIIPFILTIMILPLTVFFGYVYDLPQLFLFTATLVFMLRRQWRLYLPLLIIATLNKETSAFLIVIFALYCFRTLNQKQFIVLLAVQAIIYIAVHGAIMFLYRNSPGSSIDWNIHYHIQQYTRYPITFLVTLLLFGGIFWMVFKGWREKPLFLRTSFNVFFIILVLFFVAGREMEFRVFIDILSIFGTLMFPYKIAARDNLQTSIDKLPPEA